MLTFIRLSDCVKSEYDRDLLTAIKETGFLPNLSAVTNIFRKKPGFPAPANAIILIICHPPNSNSWQHYQTKLSALFLDCNSG